MIAQIRLSFIMLSGATVTIFFLLMALVSLPLSAEPTQEKDSVNSSATQYLVLRLASGAPKSFLSSGSFVYPLKADKATVDDVLKTGVYFKSLQRVLQYAEEEDIKDALIFDAVQFLSDGPGPFENIAKEFRSPKIKEKFVNPDVVVSAFRQFRVSFISKMKFGEGAFVFQSPSGVAPDEPWALSTGIFVRDYDEFMTEYREYQKEVPTLITFNGRSLQ
ncbi:MAG: hypothetical protein IT462_06210 [Planctomycetes bacterium]|nr:hypothetical protein [Planctomycetota bacterium]